MAVTDYPTLMDTARRKGDDATRQIVEILNQSNPILDDIPWVECNSGTTHKTTRRSSLPSPEWRMLNKGVGLAKSGTTQVTAHCGMLEIYSEIDHKLVALEEAKGGAEGRANYLASENAAFIEGFGQEVARALFYGDPAKAEEIPGLSSMYKTVRSASVETNVISGGGSGSDNTSIWLIQWGPQSVHGIYPAGSKAGLSEEYKGVHTVKDGDGKQFEADRTHYTWDLGLVVRDPRSIVRMCNIDVSDLVANNANAAKVTDLFTRASYLLPKKSAMTRTAFYCRKEVLTALDLQCQNKTNLALNYEDMFGRRILTWRGIPIREQETLLTSESTLS